MKENKQRLGDLFALIAAASNGTIGIFNRFGFESNGTYICISFFKCLGAFLILSCLFLVRPTLAREIWAGRKDVLKLAVLSFFGIFVLYFFETWAFTLTSIPVVAFLTYASGIVAVVLGVVLLKERMSWIKVLSIFLVFGGITQMFGGLNDWDLEIGGAIFAIIGGVGYSLFLFLWKKFEIPSGLGTLWWFFGFGSLFLSVPYLMTGAPVPEAGAWPSLSALILLPTLGGLCTFL